MMALLWAKVWKWVCALGAVLAATAGVYLAGRAKGKAAEQSKTRAAESVAAAAQAKAEQLESRHETDAQVQRLPDAPAQTVGAADPGTAAGRLRDDWTRD